MSSADTNLKPHGRCPACRHTIYNHVDGTVCEQCRKDRMPRRADRMRWTRAELAIHEAMYEVEKLGAAQDLTKAVILLGEAKDKVADYVDADLEQTSSLGLWHDPWEENEAGRGENSPSLTSDGDRVQPAGPAPSYDLMADLKSKLPSGWTPERFDKLLDDDKEINS